MANARSAGVLGFIENASHFKEAYYRDKVARLRERAAGVYRKKLFGLAEEFDALADTVRHRAN